MWIKAKTSTTTFYLIRIICLVGQYFLKIPSTFNHWKHASPDFEVQGPQECLSFCICIESLYKSQSVLAVQCVWLNDSWTVQEHLDLGVSREPVVLSNPYPLFNLPDRIGDWARDCHHRYLLCNAIYLPFHYFSICTWSHLISMCIQFTHSCE